MPTPVDIGEGFFFIVVLIIREDMRTIEIVNVVKERP